MASQLSHPDEPDDRPSAAEIEQQLSRILTHPLFTKARKLSDFLQYIVRQTIANGSDGLKETVIGAAVFDRGNHFDPQIDNVVRVSANRLRSKLAEYYQQEGAADPIRIELPRGAYVPQFHVHAHSPPPAPPHAIGRQREHAALHAAFARTAAGQSSMVAISGDAGLGKSTIVEDFCRLLEQENAARTARGQCSERSFGTDAYAPLLQCLDALASGPHADPAIALLRRHAPTWYREISTASADAPPPLAAGQNSQERMRREFCAFITALSAIRPVVLSLEDVHWLDPSACDLLASLTTQWRTMRLLILVTFRLAELNSGAHPFLPLRLSLERRGECEHLPLSPLTPADVALYVQQALPHVAAHPELL